MKATESGLSETVYLAAAQERITAAALALSASPPDYIVASYLAGVAVECLFHAYRMRAGADDTGRHDFRLQAVAGNFYQGMRNSRKAAASALVEQMVARWQNNHRYRSRAAMKDWIIRNRLHIIEGNTAFRGDVVRYNTELLVEIATEIVNIGISEWANSSNK